MFSVSPIYVSEQAAQLVADKRNQELSESNRSEGYFVAESWRKGRAWRIRFVTFPAAIWQGFLAAEAGYDTSGLAH